MTAKTGLLRRLISGFSFGNVRNANPSRNCGVPDRYHAGLRAVSQPTVCSISIRICGYKARRYIRGDRSMRKRIRQLELKWRNFCEWRTASASGRREVKHPQALGTGNTHKAEGRRLYMQWIKDTVMISTKRERNTCRADGTAPEESVVLDAQKTS